MAETGCQRCLAVQHLGLTRDNLIPVTMSMHAANNAGIPILDAVILQFSGKTQSGKVLI